MYIISKDSTQLINLAHVTALYIGADECSIKADFSTGKGCQVTRYNSKAEVTTAMKMLSEAIGHTEVFSFPSSEQLRAKAITNERSHHITGKKTKLSGFHAVKDCRKLENMY